MPRTRPERICSATYVTNGPSGFSGLILTISAANLVSLPGSAELANANTGLTGSASRELPRRYDVRLGRDAEHTRPAAARKQPPERVVKGAAAGVRSG